MANQQQFHVVHSNIISAFPPKRDCLKINVNCKVIHRVDMRHLKVVCVLLGLDFEERLVHCEMFILYPSTLFSLASGILSSVTCLEGGDCARWLGTVLWPEPPL